MKQLFLIIVIFWANLLIGQEAFHNYGNIQIHDGGEVGFHTDLINNGNFNQNLGLAGFYSLDDYLIIAGTNKPIFNNVEVDVLDNLYLETSMGVTNTLSFIKGKVETPREDTNISLDFINHEVYGGEGDYTHVDGYTSVISNGEFIFPIGDEDSFRPMILTNPSNGDYFKGAYFKENPNSPTIFSNSFDTSKKQLILNKINEEEFWDLDGTKETTIVLTWDLESNINVLSEKLENLTVVGWSKELNKWEDLGRQNITGDFDEGSIESKEFIPDNYEIITIGSDIFSVASELAENTENHNFGISPNGDGINDTFVVEGIELRPNNTISIYNRWGALVYSKKGYDNSWGGISDHNLTISRSKGLPSGTYFYVLNFHDENFSWHGWIYLRR
ncbi:gliding motility-associated C-terminal domain-containing protein [Lutibacter sp. TH_r2]|uniref:gliding motility-associated C-terminal domain-containing protein n=1 Tax=Lutibacter sp. TH_r2 TaxID=3082083 RepID=UPI002954794B|nr:gliding motility-associated C-terminal domain-containing protein [Lutibacter sp. TH_r2]MDV7188532.1 gliding motility-associated C-terminal domain-containing protein [Lutibacter sp. TH_r2]